MNFIDTHWAWMLGVLVLVVLFGAQVLRDEECKMRRCSAGAPVLVDYKCLCASEAK